MQQKAQYMRCFLYDATVAVGAIAHGMFEKPIMKKHLLSGYMVNYNVYQCADNKWVSFGGFRTKILELILRHGGYAFMENS
jgi:crotonobetainyl-CoA:carnitine CoA-transferase CaiB-like acyl-CoA transferase